MLHTHLVRSMETHPKEFATEFRERMDRHLGGNGSSSSAQDPRRAKAYARQLPLEKQRVLGYHVWTLAAIYKQLRKAEIGRSWRASAGYRPRNSRCWTAIGVRRGH